MSFVLLVAGALIVMFLASLMSAVVIEYGLKMTIAALLGTAAILAALAVIAGL